jgi:hypothetical protein
VLVGADRYPARVPRGTTIAVAAGALALAVTPAGGWAAARKPAKPRIQAVPGAAACVSANRTWARSLKRLRGRTLPALPATQANGSDVADLNDVQLDRAQAIVEAAVTNGALRGLVGANWQVVDVQPLANPADDRTEQAPVYGAEVNIDVGTPLAVDAAVPATAPIPTRPLRLRRSFAGWRSLGYVPYCARLTAFQLNDLTVDVDMRPGVGRITDVFPGSNSDWVPLPGLRGQGRLPPGA